MFLILLGGFREWGHILIPAITTFSVETKDASIKAETLSCLSTLLDKQASEWEYLQKMLYADPEQSDLELRKTATRALALHHPGEDGVTIAALLEEAIT